jgi:hypothetical protein
MASGITHVSVGPQLSQVEFEAADSHEASGPVTIATGAIVAGVVSPALILDAAYGDTASVNTIDWQYTGQTTRPVRIGALFNVAGSGLELAIFTSMAHNANGTERVRICRDGAVRFVAYGAGAASFDAYGNIVSASDERLKTDIQPFLPGLAEILKIDPIKYKWSKESGLDTENTYAGFSAQNVKGYIPEAVGTNSDGFYSLSDRAIIGALVNAVKELKAEVDTLRDAARLPVKEYPISPDLTDDRIIKHKPIEMTEPGDIGPVNPVEKIEL